MIRMSIMAIIVMDYSILKNKQHIFKIFANIGC